MVGKDEINFHLRSATAEDAALIHELIRELAEYERLADEVRGSPDDIHTTLFGAHPQAEVILAFAGSEPAGFALFFHNYSTFLARRGLYLEDLFVRPRFRGHGCGRRLMAHLAQIALDRGCGRMEWSVLDWNERAIDFYRSLGARSVSGWTVYRLTGTNLNELAEGT